MNRTTAIKKQLDLLDSGLRFHCYSLMHELKIYEIMSKHGGFISAEKICEGIKGRKINPRYLQRIMRYLSQFQVFMEKKEDGVVLFQVTEVLNMAFDIQRVAYLKVAPNLISLLDGNLKSSTLYEDVMGFKVEENYKGDSFKKSMKDRTYQILHGIPQIAQEIISDGKENSIIVDVGGSTGELLNLLREIIPTMTYINFDLLEVIRTNEKVDNIRMMAGDMFNAETIPDCDVIITKNILHDLNDEDCVKMLANFHKVLPEDGLLLSVNNHVAEPNEKEDDYLSFSLDIMMMMVFDGAKERTLLEYKDIYQKAGFEIKKFIPLKSEIHSADLLTAKKMR